GFLSLHSTDVAWGLTEPPAAGAPGEESLISLDGVWKYVPGEARGLAAIPADDSACFDAHVPGHVSIQGLDHEGGVGTFFKTIALPAGWADRRVKLRFDGVYSGA